jgi:hypothetical protein
MLNQELGVLIFSAILLASSAPAVKTGDDWLRLCESHTPPTCAAGIRGYYTGLKFQNEPTVCANVRLDKAEDFKPMAAAVIAYLRKHPEIRAQDYGRALLAALRATHPCRRH